MGNGITSPRRVQCECGSKMQRQNLPRHRRTSQTHQRWVARQLHIRRAPLAPAPALASASTPYPIGDLDEPGAPPAAPAAAPAALPPPPPYDEEEPGVVATPEWDLSPLKSKNH